MGIQMNRQELTKTVVMIANWKEPFGLQAFHKKNQRFKGWSAKLNNLNFHPLEAVSRYRDPQLQAGEITHICSSWDQRFVNLSFHSKWLRY